MRLFAAVTPPPDALAHLRLAADSVRASGAPVGLRWVDPELWHVTAAFYGEVPDGAWPGLAESLAEQLRDCRAPRLVLRGAGSFAGRNLWVGVAGQTPADAEALAALVVACGAAAEDVGLPAEGRERRRSHLTLARVTGPRAPNALVHALSVYSGPAWRAGSVHLIHSTLGAGRRGGPLHVGIAEFPLLP